MKLLIKGIRRKTSRKIFLKKKQIHEEPISALFILPSLIYLLVNNCLNIFLGEDYDALALKVAVISYVK